MNRLNMGQFYFIQLPFGSSKCNTIGTHDILTSNGIWRICWPNISFRFINECLEFRFDCISIHFGQYLGTSITNIKNCHKSTFLCRYQQQLNFMFYQTHPDKIQQGYNFNILSHLYKENQFLLQIKISFCNFSKCVKIIFPALLHSRSHLSSSLWLVYTPENQQLLNTIYYQCSKLLTFNTLEMGAEQKTLRLQTSHFVEDI